MIFLFALVSYLQDTYDFKKEHQKFTLKAGKYIIDCYGAQGGGGMNDGHHNSKGGKGAHVQGTLNITGDETVFYATVGEQGKEHNSYKNSGGYNGGGSSGYDISPLGNDASGGGGGATDLRINNEDLSNRIIVAAGGSGGAGHEDGAPGGDLTGKYKSGKGIVADSTTTTQTKGNADGKGGDGTIVFSVPSSGGGGGWRGGVASGKLGDIFNGEYELISDSGSSFVSDQCGCQKNLVSFIEGKMEIGTNEGNGYLTVTTVFQCPSNCGSCDSENTCYSCLNGLKLYHNTCTESCPDGSYESGSACLDCPEGCRKCSQSGTSCQSCLDGYFMHENLCYIDCPQTDDKHYGKDNVNMKCEECRVDKCIDCSQDSTKCAKCIDFFHYDIDQQMCVPNPTSVFTASSVFSGSNEFTKSSPFTKSDSFSSSAQFTKSSPFTKSSAFTRSSPFTKSSVFTRSETFTMSSEFTRSSPFTTSSVFTDSSPFTKSSAFTGSDLFTGSSCFTESLLFSQSSSFTESSPFTESLPFTKSRTFTRSKRFTRSDKFTKSNTFSISSPFTLSTTFVNQMTTATTESTTLSVESSETTATSSLKTFILSNSNIFSQSLIVFDRNVDLFESDDSKNRLKSYWWILVVLGVVVFAALIVFFIYKKRKNKNEITTEEIAAGNDESFTDNQIVDQVDDGEFFSADNPLYNNEGDDPFEKDFEELL